jgi:hypothetical protein
LIDSAVIVISATCFCVTENTLKQVADYAIPKKRHYRIFSFQRCPKVQVFALYNHMEPSMTQIDMGCTHHDG